MRLTARLFAALVVLLMACPAFAQRLTGFADTHSHPMSHLGFGGMILYGSPDPSLPMLAGTKYRGFDLFNPECNPSTEIAGSAAGALGNCNALHGAPGPENDCGDVIRSALIDQVEEKYVFEYPNPGLFGQVNDHPHNGYPGFSAWPHWSTVTHQQMYWEWVRRAWQGGQRVLVALAVNNSLLAKAGNAREAIDDRASVDLQLDNIVAFVGAHGDFMEIARSPSELRDIVTRGKLAVILGVETDDFGNLTRRAAAGETITDAIISEEIRHLFVDKGVRYLLPIHFSDTVLGGYAINKDLFALSSKEYRNAFPSPVDSCGAGVHYELKRAQFDSLQADMLRTRDLGRIIDAQPTYTPPATGCGHVNSRTLQPIGERALAMLMARGMMIDIDHMSRLTADRALQVAFERDYPLSSGHNGMLDPNCLAAAPSGDPKRCNENARTQAQYERIRAIRGMVGMGHAGGSTNFVRSYRQLLTVLGNRPMAIGTDANGLEALPAPDPLAPVTYDSSFPRYTFDGHAFDYNDVGFAHYGMFPDFLRSLQSSPTSTLRMTTAEMSTFLSSAEQFARTWERSVLRSAGAPRLTALALSTNWCTHSSVTGVLYGDINGDGAEDVLCRDPGRLWTNLTNVRGEITGTTDAWVDTTWCSAAGSTLQLADVDGDGRADLVCRDGANVRVDYADRNARFAGVSETFATGFCPVGSTLHLGDFNGDGRADLLCRDAAGAMRIDLASELGRYSGVSDSSTTAWCAAGTFSLGDLNGDGRTDLICRTATNISADYASTAGFFTGTNYSSPATAYCTHAGARPSFADVNGDGRVDWICKDSAQIWVDYADAEGTYDGADWARSLAFCTGATDTLAIEDVNGDSRADLVCKNPTTVNVRYSLLTAQY